MKDFFVSYSGSDEDWAEWIAWTLEEDGGYTVVIQAWDFRPGENFVVKMQRATVETARTVAVLSPTFLDSAFAKPEWAAAFAQDPTGAERKLIPIRVEPCDPPGLLAGLIYADLVGLDPESARATVLQAVADRAKPAEPPAFPGHRGGGTLGVPMAPRSMPPAYPGRDAAAVASGDEGRGKAAEIWREKLAFLRRHQAIAADPAQKLALAEQIREAERKLGALAG